MQLQKSPFVRLERIFRGESGGKTANNRGYSAKTFSVVTTFHVIIMSSSPVFSFIPLTETARFTNGFNEKTRPGTRKLLEMKVVVCRCVHEIKRMETLHYPDTLLSKTEIELSLFGIAKARKNVR